METVRILHLLAMAFFVGGQLMLAAVLIPLMRGDQRLRTVARRFGAASAAALIILVATGAAMAGEFEHWDDPVLHVKLAFVLAVIALIAFHARRPQLHVIEVVVFLLSLTIVSLGVALAH